MNLTAPNTGIVQTSREAHSLTRQLAKSLESLPPIATVVALNNLAACTLETQTNPSRMWLNGQAILRMFHNYSSSRMICVNGTARNSALPVASQEFLGDLATQLVTKNIGLVCGGSETGAMGHAIRSFERHSAEVATVLLNLYGTHGSYEAPQKLSRGLASPKQHSWLNRTAALHGIGQQGALLYVEGGLGTLFEIFYPLSCRQMQSKGCIGVYNPLKTPAELVFASSVIGNNTNFWQPTADLLNEMRACGFCRKEFTEHHLFAPNEIADVPLYIADHYEKKCIVPERKAQKLFDNKLLSSLADSLQTSLGFNMPTVDTNPFHSFLDNVVAGHLFVRATRETEYLPTTNLLKERAKTLEILTRLADRSAIYIIGTDKNFDNGNLFKFLSTTIEQAVNSGETIVIDGSGKEGIPNLCSKLWAQYKKQYRDDRGVDSKSELVRVQLAHSTDETPARSFNNGLHSETLFPSVLNQETKVALAGSVGSLSNRAIVLCPGGPNEMLAFSQLLLDSQLAGSIDGCYQSVEHRPIFSIANIPGRDNGLPFYNPLIKQLQIMAGCGTINSSDFSESWFTDLSKPIATASRLSFQL